MAAVVEPGEFYGSANDFVDNPEFFESLAFVVVQRRVQGFPEVRICEDFLDSLVNQLTLVLVKPLDVLQEPVGIAGSMRHLQLQLLAELA